MLQAARMHASSRGLPHEGQSDQPHIPLPSTSGSSSACLESSVWIHGYTIGRSTLPSCSSSASRSIAGAAAGPATAAALHTLPPP